MQSVQESKQELEASIRYAENAISSAKATIESMEFRQEMAKKQYAEQTGREQALEAQVAQLKSDLDKLRKEKEASSGPCGCQVYRDLEEEIAKLKDENKALRQQKENLRIQVVDQAEFDRDVRDAITDFILALKTTGMEIDE